MRLPEIYCFTGTYSDEWDGRVGHRLGPIDVTCEFFPFFPLVVWSKGLSQVIESKICRFRLRGSCGRWLVAQKIVVQARIMI
jgi:hypothetical protein